MGTLITQEVAHRAGWSVRYSQLDPTGLEVRLEVRWPRAHDQRAKQTARYCALSSSACMALLREASRRASFGQRLYKPTCTTSLHIQMAVVADWSILGRVPSMDSKRVRNEFT